MAALSVSLPALADQDSPAGTLSADFQAGHGGYRDGTGTLSLSPMPDFTLNLRGGMGRSGTEAGDASVSLGLGANVMVVEGVSLGAGFDSCQAGRGYLLGPAMGEVVGDLPSRQVSRALSFDLSVEPLAMLAAPDESGGGPGQGGFVDYLRLDVGLSGENQSIPVRREGGSRTANFGITDRIWSGGLSTGLGGTDLGVWHRRHHRGDLAPPSGFDRLPPALAGLLLARIRDAVARVTSEPVLWQTGFTMNEPVSGGFSVYGAFELARLAVSGALSRTYRAEGSFRLTERLTLRGGACWVREYGTTEPFGTLGAAWRFR
jgi:hypothetical protein